MNFNIKYRNASISSILVFLLLFSGYYFFSKYTVEKSALYSFFVSFVYFFSFLFLNRNK